MKFKLIASGTHEGIATRGMVTGVLVPRVWICRQRSRVRQAYHVIEEGGGREGENVPEDVTPEEFKLIW